MEKSIFKFSEQDFKQQIIQENKLIKKLKYSFNYLLNYLPINNIDENFSFDNIKIREGKSYDWFFLIKDNINILIRQYRNHFTFVCLNKDKEHSYFDKISIFTITDNHKNMDGNTNDEYVDDPYLTLKQILPSLLEIIKKDKVHMIWNPLSLVRPDFTEIKLAQINETSYSLDLLLFVCDEVSHTHLELFSENDMMKKLNDFNIGDTLKDSYVITKIVKNDKNDDNFHNNGLYFYNKSDTLKKTEWNDIYSLTRYYLDYIFKKSSD